MVEKALTVDSDIGNTEVTGDEQQILDIGNTDIGNIVACEGIENIVSDIERVVEVKVIGDLASSTFD